MRPLAMACAACFLLLICPVSQLRAQGWMVESVPLPVEKHATLIDPDSVLGYHQAQLLGEKLRSVESETHLRITVVFLSSIGSERTKAFTSRLFQRLRSHYGSTDWKPNLLLLAIIDQRRMESETDDRSVLTPTLLSDLQRGYSVPYFKDGDFGKGMNALINAVEAAYRQSDSTEIHVEPERASSDKTHFSTIILVLLGALVVIYLLGLILNTGSTGAKALEAELAFDEDAPVADQSITADPWDETKRYGKANATEIKTDLGSVPVHLPLHTSTEQTSNSTFLIVYGVVMFLILLTMTGLNAFDFEVSSKVFWTITLTILFIVLAVVMWKPLREAVNPPIETKAPRFQGAEVRMTLPSVALTSMPLLLAIGNSLSGGALYPVFTLWTYPTLIWLSIGLHVLYNQLRDNRLALRSWDDPYFKYQHLRHVNTELPLYVIIFPPLFLPCLNWYLRKKRELRNWPRHDSKGEHMRLLSEAEEDAFLSTGQQVEEALLTVDHDVWINATGEEVLILPYAKYQTEFIRCRNCKHIACEQIGDNVVVNATTKQEGWGRRVFECRHCGHSYARRYSIAQLSDSYSSSLDSGDSGGGDSGGDGGSSW